MIRSISLFALLLCGTHLAKARPLHVPETKDPNALRVQVTGLAQSKGYLMVAVYSSKDRFLSEEHFAAHKIAVEDGGPIELTLNLPPGQYAIAVYHDANGNGKLDRNMFQFPTEPYGFSNNARSRTGPPAWNDVRFNSELTEQLTIQLL
jgi:uncharacterized protein (DUF2141 family)